MSKTTEQAVPVDWQSLAISRYERVQELLQERDSLLAALRGTVNALMAYNVESPALRQARAAIAQAEGRAS